MTEVAEPLLSVEHLRVAYHGAAGTVTAIPDLSFHVRPGESFGIVGESGCGKSTLLMAIMGHLGQSGRVAGGSIVFDGTDITRPGRDQNRVRGRGVAMVYQDPNAALNPTMKVGAQLMEVPVLTQGVSATEARQRVRRMLGDVHLPQPETIMERYPHQMSGGQKQRVVIAMALLANPKLLLLDEPTTGLDVTVEAAVLDLISELQVKYGTALIYITHNLGVVARVCARVGVMYLGDLVEEAPVRELFANPRHPYTRRLMDCVPQLGGDKHSTSFLPIAGQPPSLARRPPGCPFAPRCPGFQAGRCDHPVPEEAVAPLHRVRCVRWQEADVFSETGGTAVEPGRPGNERILEVANLSTIYDIAGGAFGFGARARKLIANEDLNFDAAKGEILAVVGESGSGKSTFARVLSGLNPATSGTLALRGDDIGRRGATARTPQELAAIQMVFQNPDATLNPSHTAAFPLKRVLKKFGIASGSAAIDAHVDRLFDLVRLPRSLRHQRPARLSGGQKQRVAIARAFAADPEILVADEPVSALDVSVQAAIVNLLLRIQAEKQTTIIFISHDLALVHHLADRVIVMYLGKIMEQGPVAQVFAPPYHPYTEALLSAVPVADPTAQQKHIRLKGDPPSPIDVPKGCRFSARCPRHIGPICNDVPPPLRDAGEGHSILCHIPLEGLAVALQ